MVKDISKQNVRYDFGNLSISVDAVISILESKGELNITAKNGDVEFENLDDIKAHKSLFAGQPEIFTDNAYISFKRYYMSVSPRWDSKNTNITKSIYNDIILHKSFIDKFFDLPIFNFGYIVIINSIYFLYVFASNKIDINGYINFSVFISNFTYLTLLLAAFSWDIYSKFYRNSVYYNVKERFFKRNFDTIAVSTVTGIIALTLGAFIPSFLEKLKAWF